MKNKRKLMNKMMMNLKQTKKQMKMKKLKMMVINFINSLGI